MHEEQADHHRSRKVPQPEMHERIVNSLGIHNLESHRPFDEKPFEVDLKPPLPKHVRIYVFNATRPPGGRPLGEHKVQLIVPGQERKDKGNFDHSGGRIVLLAGYVADEDVYVFWDAGLYADFAWSRNVQVKVETIVSAAAGNIATQERQLRPKNSPPVSEVLVAVRSDRIVEGIQQRIELTRSRMLAE